MRGLESRSGEPRILNVAEFEQQADSLRCQQCKRAGLRTDRTEPNPNNGGVQVVCPHCGSRRPLGPVTFLKQNHRKRRDPIPGEPSVEEIWATWGGRCAVCGLPSDTLRDHGIGRQRHHAWPYAEHGHNGPLLPVCVLCHRVVTALQQNARAIAGVENAATRIPPNPSDNHSRS